MFASALLPLLEKKHPKAIAVAVSGGPDSLALVLLTAEWAAQQSTRVLALHVDHGLRKESAAEARQVEAWLAARNIPCRILRWRPGTVSSRVQEAARAARYALLLTACAEEKISTLLLAHQADDQAETVLMRLCKGSGVDGLAGMPPVRSEAGVKIVRPLLGFAKESLIATCRARGQKFFTDPGNRAERFARGRLRRVAKALAAEGLTRESLNLLAQRMRRAREVLDGEAEKLWRRAMVAQRSDAPVFTLSVLRRAHPEIACRVLRQAMAQMADSPALPVRLTRLWDLHQKIIAGTDTSATLAGCLFRVKAGQLTLTTEKARKIKPGEGKKKLPTPCLSRI